MTCSRSGIGTNVPCVRPRELFRDETIASMSRLRQATGLKPEQGPKSVSFPSVGRQAARIAAPASQSVAGSKLKITGVRRMTSIGEQKQATSPDLAQVQRVVAELLNILHAQAKEIEQLTMHVERH